MKVNDIDNKSERKDKGITMKEIIITIVGAILVSIIVMQFIVPTVVDGVSMNNTLKDGQHLFLNKVAYKSKQPEYKDIVVVKRNDLSVKFLIKRVIGVPGDHLVIKNNKLYINDEEIVEDYINQDDLMVTDDIDIEVPDGKVFVMGDNRNHSVDSRSSIIGFIDIDTQVYGKVIGNY